nr:TIGR01777 family oxidoreductase [Pseudenhygromyxa sp. WMMC2535]
MTLPVSREALFAWHARPGAFERLSPSWQRVEVVDKRGGIEDGARLHIRLRKGPLGVDWIARHQGYAPPEKFEDESERGPFARWHHVHRFESLAAERSALVDAIDFALPLDPLSWPIVGGMVQGEVERMFRQRHVRTANDLRRHQQFAAAGPQRVALSGASGMVGAALGAFLTTGGHTVLPMVRRAKQAQNSAQNPDQNRNQAASIAWSPREGSIDTAALEGLDAVVHLAGEPVVGRWTPQKREAIMRSRVDGTSLLCEALAKLDHKPKVLVCASAVGFYGDRGDHELDEDSDPGEGFLVEVVRAWEDATRAAEEAGIRVVNLRIGVVLSPQGGALSRLLLPARFGLGGPVGSGRQWQSVIDLDDLLGVVLHAIHDERLRGPVNAVGPQPLRQRDFARQLGALLHRPAVMPLPAAIVRAIFGQLGDEVLLASQRVLPRRLEAAGFHWDFPSLEDSLRHQLGRADERDVERAALAFE